MDDPVDVAFSMNALVMNGGLDHAFELVVDTLPAAAEGFRAAGRHDIVALLEQFVKVVATDGVPTSAEERAYLLETLTDLDLVRVQELVDAYTTAPDPQSDLEQL
jgi:hypothetical protein